MIDSYSALCARLDALAETPTELLATLDAHEALLHVDDFSLDDAWQLGTSLHALAQAHALDVAISITLGTQRAFHAALPGTASNNDAWAARKTAVVTMFGHSSWRVGVDAAIKGDDVNERLSAADYAAHGGAFPIRTRGGALLGVVAISGLPSAHDHAMAVLGLAQLVGANPSSL